MAKKNSENVTQLFYACFCSSHLLRFWFSSSCVHVYVVLRLIQILVGRRLCRFFYIFFSLSLLLFLFCFCCFCFDCVRDGEKFDVIGTQMGSIFVGVEIEATDRLSSMSGHTELAPRRSEWNRKMCNQKNVFRTKYILCDSNAIWHPRLAHTDISYEVRFKLNQFEKRIGLSEH